MLLARPSGARNAVSIGCAKRRFAQRMISADPCCLSAPTCARSWNEIGSVRSWCSSPSGYDRWSRRTSGPSASASYLRFRRGTSATFLGLDNPVVVEGAVLVLRKRRNPGGSYRQPSKCSPLLKTPQHGSWTCSVSPRRQYPRQGEDAPLTKQC
jgi:hypothetical protein